MNNQSYFKLPLIFTSIYFPITIFWFLINLFIIQQIDLNEYTTSLIVGGIFSIIFSLSLFFITVTFLCAKYHLYTTQTKEISTFILVAIIFSILAIGFSFLFNYAISFVYIYLLESGHHHYIAYLSFFHHIIVNIIHVIILILLFKALFASTTQQRPASDLEGIIGQKVYASVYTQLVLLSSLFSASIFVYGAIVYLQYALGLEIGAILLTLTLSFIISYLLHYWFIYATTFKQFQVFSPKLKAKPLLKSFGLTILFMFIGSFILSAILMIIIISQLSSSYYYSTPPVFIFWLVTLAVIFSYIILFISTRLGVKCIFGERKNNTQEASPLIETE